MIKGSYIATKSSENMIKKRIDKVNENEDVGEKPNQWQPSKQMR